MPSEPQLTEDEKACEDQFRQQYYRDETGRYVVPLPFKINISHPFLGDSYGAAINRLRILERRLQANPQFANDYSKCLREHIELDHMEIIDEQEENENVNYLAHHAVVKVSSSTTKLRVVFDASNPTSNGRSLNDILLIGPRLQQDLAFILLRWRKHKYVLSADIEKMYRPPTKSSQLSSTPTARSTRPARKRISHEKSDIRRSTFDIRRQYMAVKAIQQLADDEKDEFP